VKDKVADILLNQESFKDVDEILNNENLIDYIRNHNKVELERLL
jgi:hypothetical protein